MGIEMKEAEGVSDLSSITRIGVCDLHWTDQIRRPGQTT